MSGTLGTACLLVMSGTLGTACPLIMCQNRLPVRDGGGAVGAVGQEQAPHAEVVLERPVLRLGVPVVELADQRQRLVGAGMQQTLSAKTCLHACMHTQGPRMQHLPHNKAVLALACRKDLSSSRALEPLQTFDWLIGNRGANALARAKAWGALHGLRRLARTGNRARTRAPGAHSRCQMPVLPSCVPGLSP